MGRIHRIVIHPDWQGIGLGKRFATEVAKQESISRDVFLQTSNVAMKHALFHYDRWSLQRNSRTHRFRTTRKDFVKTMRSVKTASFVYRRKHE